MIAGLACCPASLLAQEEAQRPRHKISAAQLHEALSARFPVRWGLAGLLQLRLSTPRLLLMPARNKLGAALVLEMSGAQAQQLPAGEMDVVFALRYEASDQTVRAHRPELLDLRWPGMAPEVLPTLQAVLPEATRKLGEVVMHKLSPRELALPDTMGFEPSELQVADDGLLVLFGPKRRK